MRILTRYVLREFLLPFCYCLIGFISIYVLFDLFGSFSRMSKAGIGFSTAVMYFCGYLAPYFHYIVPAALMLATLYTMWNFCRHSEIVAMRASGISFMTIVKPLLAVALLMSGAVAYVNEEFVPSKSQWAAQMKTDQFDLKVMDASDDIIYCNYRDHRTWRVDRVLDVDWCHLQNVWVLIDRPDSGVRLMKITADQADFLDGEWWFTNTRICHYDSQGKEEATTTPELDALTYRCFPEFSEKPVDFIAQNRPWKFNSVRDRMRYLRTHPDLTEEIRNERTYDAWAQLMAPLACLIITLFAIPAGIASGRQSVFKGILGALGLYFAYYGLTILGKVVAPTGYCPPVLAAVLPAVLFLGIGIRMFIKQR